MDAGCGRLDAGLAGEVANVRHLVVGHQRDDDARGTGSGGATGAMQVSLVLDRRVGMDDQGDVVDVDTSGCDVSGDKGVRRASVEGVHVAGPRVLGEVAMELDSWDTGGVELLGELLGAVLGASEDHRSSRGRREVDQYGKTAVMVHMKDVVRHRRDRRLCRVRAVGHRVGEEALDDHVDARVQRCREQHPLTGPGGAVHDPSHGRQETEVGHVVGLVQNGDLDGVKGQRALADEVLEPSRAGDHDVDTGAKAADLGVLADATEDGDAVDPERLGQWAQCSLDLADQLTGRRHDERPRLAGLAGALACDQSGEQGEKEGIGLARAGAATAENVATRQRVGQGGSLDRSRDGDACRRKNGGQGSGHAKAGESGVRRHR